ncbi:dynein regulatory complex subunit 5 [Stegostoma tigrinum]|uniref:dynein regulatory complex subunit 5 n=1 Tax=Stegostoma tigrinum TaxID=3053191 RepID=UPI00202B58BB|nr:dynein regulatory complex subunit 5 [Stegostoma tigrinum]XP_059501063.1 dynein regulatory complex subunit 5 [Stegostoma tigrinum]
MQLQEKDRRKVLAKISTNIPLQVTANLVSDEGYWKRCCLECWEVCDISSYGDSWKRMFFERLLKNIIEFFVPDTTDVKVVLDLVPLCRNYVKTLDIAQLLPPVKQSPEAMEDDSSDAGSDSDVIGPSIDHFDFSILLNKLINLEELHVTYGVKDCGMNFEWNIFQFTYRDCFSLAKAISSCKTLKVLKLPRNRIDDEKLRVLVKYMLNHPSLIELDLSHNLIEDNGAKVLAKLLHKTKLEKVNLCNNHISAYGAKAISYKVRRFSSLKSINFRLNQIGDEGGEALGRALVKSSVEDINLSCNELTEPVAVVFSELLTKNHTLKTIDLSCNNFGLEGGRQLQEGMSMNKTVMELDLRLTDIGQENEYAINQILHSNRERVKNAVCHPFKAIKASEVVSDHYLAED